MQSLQFYKYAAGFLLLLNIGFITFLWLNKPSRHHRQNRVEHHVIKILELDEEQTEEFKTYAREHGKELKSIETKQQDLLLPYFNSLIDTTLAIDKDSILRQVQALEVDKIQITYQHFEDVKAILKPEQDDNYLEFTQFLLRRISLKPENNPKK